MSYADFIEMFGGGDIAEKQIKTVPSLPSENAMYHSRTVRKSQTTDRTVAGLMRDEMIKNILGEPLDAAAAIAPQEEVCGPRVTFTEDEMETFRKAVLGGSAKPTPAPRPARTDRLARHLKALANPLMKFKMQYAEEVGRDLTQAEENQFRDLLIHCGQLVTDAAQGV